MDIKDFKIDYNIFYINYLLSMLYKDVLNIIYEKKRQLELYDKLLKEIRNSRIEQEFEIDEHTSVIIYKNINTDKYIYYSLIYYYNYTEHEDLNIFEIETYYDEIGNDSIKYILIENDRFDNIESVI